MLAKVIVRNSPARGFGEAVCYIARDNPDQATEPRPGMGALSLDCPLDSPEDRQSAIDILDATAAAARHKTVRSLVYHVTLAWQQAEHPTIQQIDAACAHVLNTLGFEGHEALWALHRDTDHDHVHLIVNRVHTDGHTAKVPKYDWLLLDQAMREIEIAQGWRSSPGPFVTVNTAAGPEVVRMSRAERARRGMGQDGPQPSPAAAQASHREGGAASFQEWAAGGPAKAIKAVIDTPVATWERVHQQAARYGLRIEPKGSGMVVTTTMDDGRVLAAKASQLGRSASKAALEMRLGPYQPPQGAMPAPEATYQKALDADKVYGSGQGARRGVEADDLRFARRAERAAARKALAARFKAEQDAARRVRPAQRAALVQQHRAERAGLAAGLREERKTLPEQARQQDQPLTVVQSLWAMHAAQQREALQKRQAAERRALSARQPKQDVWRKWLEHEAGQGDEAAQAALRGIRYREQRNRNKSQDGIEGEELDPLRKLTLAGLEAQIDPKRQLVLYRGADGREKFTDTGPRIVLHDKSDDSLEAALRMAGQKYGGKVDITGSAEFRERAARQAVRLGIEVADADLQAVVRDEQDRLRQARQTATQHRSTESVDKSPPTPAQPAPEQARTATPEKQGTPPSPRERAAAAMEQAALRWVVGSDRTAAPVREFIAAHDRARQQGVNGRELIAEVVDRVVSRRGEGASASLGGFMAAISRQRERELGTGR